MDTAQTPPRFARVGSVRETESIAARRHWRRIEAGALDLLDLSLEGLLQPSMLERVSRLPLALLTIAPAWAGGSPAPRSTRSWVKYGHGIDSPRREWCVSCAPNS